MRQPDALTIRNGAGISTRVIDDECSNDIVARKPKKIRGGKSEAGINGHLQTNRVRSC